MKRLTLKQAERAVIASYHAWLRDPKGGYRRAEAAS